MPLKDVKKSLRAFEARGVKRKLQDMWYRTEMDAESERAIVDMFHGLYYDAAKFHKTWRDTHFQGIRVLKNPMDLWRYQEILTEVGPDLIVETGTRYGGSALYLATLCASLGRGRVLTIDIEHPEPVPQHSRIEYFLGSSVDAATLDHVRSAASDAHKVLVILDSDHSCDHVIQEMRLYAPIVTPGSFLIVEDSNLNGHPVHPDFGPGPYEAIEEFLRESDDFAIDEKNDKFLLTFNPQGYLRKKR